MLRRDLHRRALKVRAVVGMKGLEDFISHTKKRPASRAPNLRHDDPSKDMSDSIGREP